MRVRPFRNGQISIWPHAPAPGAQHILGPVKAEIQTLGQVVVVFSFMQG